MIDYTKSTFQYWRRKNNSNQNVEGLATLPQTLKIANKILHCLVTYYYKLTKELVNQVY